MRMAQSGFEFTKNETMFVAFSKDALDHFMTDAENMKLSKKRTQNKTRVNALYNSKDKTLLSDETDLRIKIDSKKYHFPGDIAVYKDIVRLTSYKDQIGIIIENRDIAQTLKSIFKLAIKSTQNKNS